MGYLALFWTHGNCHFSSFHMCLSSSSTRLRHVRTSVHFLVKMIAPHIRASALPPRPSAHYCSPKPVTHGHSAPAPLTPQPTQSHTLAIFFSPLRTYLDTSPFALNTQQDSGSWRSYYQPTDYLLICCLAAAGCVKALILQLNFFTEGGTAEHELLYRGNYASYRVTALTSTAEACCLWVAFEVFHTTAAVHISQPGLVDWTFVCLSSWWRCVLYRCVSGVCMVKLFCFLFASFLGERDSYDIL